MTVLSLNSWTSAETGFLLCDVCQVFTAADFSCCLFVALSVLVLSSASEMQLNRVKIRRLTQPLQNIPLLLPSKTPGLLLLLCFGSSFICTMKRRPISFAAFELKSVQRVYLYTLQN